MIHSSETIRLDVDTLPELDTEVAISGSTKQQEVGGGVCLGLAAGIPSISSPTAVEPIGSAMPGASSSAAGDPARNQIQTPLSEWATILHDIEQ